MATRDPPWQEILDKLTRKAGKEGLLRSVKNAKTFEEKINKVVDSSIRNKLSTWISQCAESRYAKSGGTATRLRDEGNAKFRSHDNEGAIRIYTESIIIAPEYGPELCLGYGNRSAALYHGGQYQDCLQDIELAFKYKYPKNLQHKLHQRKGSCLTQLGNHTEAKNAFNIAISALDFVPKLAPEKKESMIRDINALMAEAKSTSQRLSQDEPIIPAQILEPPSLPNHSSLPGAASILELKHENNRGRFVIANKPVKVGDVLFSELPYASILLPEHYSSHCHHCHKELTAPVSCIKCTQPRYCSESCRSQSWSTYHQHECSGLDLLHSVGIAHLAMRIVLVTGLPRLLRFRQVSQKSTKTEVESEKQDETPDPYQRVYDLEHHVDDLEPEDLFQYIVTAVLLGSYLEQRTKFFATTCDTASSNLENLSLTPNKVDRLPNISAGQSKSKEVDESIFQFICCLLLRHITQLVCNGHAIYDVGACDTDLESNDNPVISNNQFRIATAIYPSASMMNHSCDPTVINSFFNKRLIVRAIKSVKAGGNVFNCYGPHFRRHSLTERQETLKAQYHFVCDCISCKRKEMVEFQERFSALRCHHCGGPIQNPVSEAALNHSMPCFDCGKVQPYSDRIEQVFVAYDLYKKGMEAYEYGCLSDALPALQSCYQIRVKAMYAHHREVTEVADQLARCYAMMGSFSESAQYLKVCLPAIQERYGPHSIEVGHELIKYTDVLLGDLQDTTKRSSQYGEKLSEARTCLERALQIFELHYGVWHKTHREIAQKLANISVLVDA